MASLQQQETLERYSAPLRADSDETEYSTASSMLRSIRENLAWISSRVRTSSSNDETDLVLPPAEQDRGQKGPKIHWLEATSFMVAETISLGILSLPRAVSKIGLVPGGMLTVGLGMLTTYTGYIVYQFWMANRDVRSFPDAMALVAGRTGRWLAEIMQMVFLVFLMAGHLLVFSQEINTFSDSYHCSVLFTVLAMVFCIACTMPRSLRSSSWFGIASCVSIMMATFTALIDIRLRWKGDSRVYNVTPLTPGISSFAEACLAVSNILVSYTGHIAYLPVVSEMDRAEDFPKALCLTNVVTVSMYTIVGVVIYFYAGQDVASPALAAASPLIHKVAFGLATPTIIVAGVIAAIVSCKRLYDIVWSSNEAVKTENSKKAWLSWAAIVVGHWILALIVANVIPFFSSLLALIGAAAGTWIALGIPAMMWVHLRRNENRTWSWRMLGMSALITTILMMCLVFSGIGLYGSIEDIRSNAIHSPPFSCNNDAL